MLRPSVPCSLCLLSLLFSSSSATNCVRPQRLRLSEAVVSSVRALCRVADVTSCPSCVQLCIRESHCAAARHHGVAKRCDLLTARFDRLEGAAALANVSGDVEVWAIPGRGFGQCPASYTAASWRSSRYRTSTEQLTWSSADRRCREERGKMAEITTMEEKNAIENKLPDIGHWNYFYLGAHQDKGARNQMEGWTWVYSGVPFINDMWIHGEPNGFSRGENVVGLEKYSIFGLKYFRIFDITSAQSRKFICECHVIE